MQQYAAFHLALHCLPKQAMFNKNFICDECHGYSFIVFIYFSSNKLLLEYILKTCIYDYNLSILVLQSSHIYLSRLAYVYMEICMNYFMPRSFF